MKKFLSAVFAQIWGMINAIVTIILSPAFLILMLIISAIRREELSDYTSVLGDMISFDIAAGYYVWTNWDKKRNTLKDALATEHNIKEENANA